MLGKVFNYISSGKTENTIIVRALIVFLSTCLLSGFLLYYLSLYANDIRNFLYNFFSSFLENVFDNIVAIFSLLLSNYLIASIATLSLVLVMIIKRYMRENNHVIAVGPQNPIINLIIFLLFIYSTIQVVGVGAGTFDVKAPYYFLTYLLSSFVIFAFIFYFYLINTVDNYHDILIVIRKNKIKYSILAVYFFFLSLIELLSDNIFIFQLLSYAFLFLFLMMRLSMTDKPYSQKVFDARLDIVRLRNLNLNQDISHKKESLDHGSYTFITSIDELKGKDDNCFILNKVLNQVNYIGYDANQFCQKIFDLDLDEKEILCITVYRYKRKRIVVSNTKDFSTTL